MNKKKKEKNNATRIMAVNHSSLAYLARKAAIVNGVGVAKATPRYHGGFPSDSVAHAGLVRGVLSIGASETMRSGGLHGASFGRFRFYFVTR